MVISAHSAQYTAQKNAYKVRQISSVVGVVFLLPENIEFYMVKPVVCVWPHQVCYVQHPFAWPPVLVWLAKAFESPSCPPPASRNPFLPKSQLKTGFLAGWDIWCDLMQPSVVLNCHVDPQGKGDSHTKFWLFLALTFNIFCLNDRKRLLHRWSVHFNQALKDPLTGICDGYWWRYYHWRKWIPAA